MELTVPGTLKKQEDAGAQMRRLPEGPELLCWTRQEKPGLEEQRGLEEGEEA